MAEDLTIQLVPQEKLPESWNDKDRVNVLFAPFRTRTVNPHDWDAKYLFWKSFIKDCCVHSKVYSFKLDDLQTIFKKDGRIPACLSTVIEQMVLNNEVQSVEQFLQKPIKSWSSWATNLIKKPVLWSLEKVKQSVTSPKSDEIYVHLSAIETEADSLLLSIPDNFKGKVINFDQLLSVLNISPNRSNNIKLLLHHLLCKDQVDVKELENNTKSTSHNLLLKFGDIQKIKPISDIEISTYILEQNEVTLTTKLEKLENEVQEILDEAKNHLTKGLRQMAKNCLRKKHELENEIIKRSNALQNVQALLLRIRDSTTDQQILDSYKYALSTMRETFKETGLTEDSVIDTMTELGDILDLHADIQQSLSQSISGNDLDLEEELNQLLISEEHPPTPPNPYSPSKPNNLDSDDLEKRLQKLRLPEIPKTVIGETEKKVLV